MVDEVSSVLLDWVSAPRAIWVEEAEISSAEVATARDETVIWVTIWRRFFTIWRIECSSQPTSSRDWLLISAVRSPLDTCSARMPSRVSGSAMSRASASAVTRPTRTVRTRVPTIISRESWNSWSAALAGSSPWTMREAATFIRSRLRSANQPRARSAA